MTNLFSLLSEKDATFIEAILFAVIVLITMLALHGTTKRSLIVGTLCDMFNIAMYVSPLTVR
jgi:solute carrier family 50 protein (sugar transporter)